MSIATALFSDSQSRVLRWLFYAELLALTGKMLARPNSSVAARSAICS